MRTKYQSKKVYACPVCLKLSQKYGEYWYCNVHNAFKKPIIFDSQTEYLIAKLHLEPLIQAGLIGDLKLHPRYKLIEKISLKKLLDNYGTSTDSYPNDMQVMFFNNYYTPKDDLIIPIPFASYKPDFVLVQEGIKKAIEVKRITKKKVSKKITDARTGKTVKVESKIDWPFFTREQPESRFKIKCQLMLIIHNLPVEIWTNTKKFRYDKNWKLEEVP